MSGDSQPAVKICGVTRVEDAERAVALGASYLGLNFHPPSPRYLEPEAARRIADAVRGRAELVGVFVNRPPAALEEIGQRVGLDLYQLHGDESPEQVGALASRAIKAFRIGPDWSAEELDAYRGVWGFLLEQRHPRLYGGAGESWDYRRIGQVRTDKPVFVAGGIGPENARRAWSESGAWGVDVCSGVESEPGLKDPALLTRLFEELSIAEDT